MVPCENPTRARRASSRPCRASSASMKASTSGAVRRDAGQHAAGPAVLQAEPLAAVGGEVAGLRAVRGHEPGVRQVAGQHRGQPDQVLAVRAHAMQQDDELARRAAGTRAEAGPPQLCHVGSRLW